MMRMNQQSDPNAAKRYYVSRAEYYEGGKQELPGRWGGEAADRLGLDGEVAKQAFDAVCLNRNPETGERLTLRDKAGRTVGYDFNFHVPKSVSILYGLTADAAILDAFRWALRATMEEIEAEAKTRVRKGGRCHDRTTGNLLFSEHVHLTARPVDGVPCPHLHAHCFVFNVTWDDQERAWKAGQFRDLKRDAPYFQAAFHARLADRLAGVGYPIERTAKGWEIAGVPAGLIRKFSQRTEQIERTAAEKGIVDANLKDALGAATRERKRNDASMEDLRKTWLGWLTPREREGLAVAVARKGTPSPALPVDHVIAAAVRNCFELEHAATVPEKHLVAEALAAGVGSVTADAIRNRLPAHGIVTRNVGGLLLCSMTEPRDQFARRQAERRTRQTGHDLGGGDRWRPADTDRFHDHVMQRQQLDAHERARASFAGPGRAAPPPLRQRRYGR